jgi:cyclase
LGAGEIIVNSIDDDGVMKGYDLELVGAMYHAINAPLTILGGAGSLEHIRELMSRFRQLGAAAGSLFVYKGKFKAVLINYPTAAEKQALLASTLATVA